ncbi:MAG: hypothetical protein ACE5GY_07780 [Thermodesulfobacteriota bacterium]
MATPVIGDIIESTVGRVVERLADRFLPAALSGKQREELRLKARELAAEESRTAMAGVNAARELAGREAEGAPAWTRVLTVTHRPAWSFLTLGIFAWTVLAPYLGFPSIPLTDVHKDVMQTVIIFYFGGRSIEKAASIVRDRDWG